MGFPGLIQIVGVRLLECTRAIELAGTGPANARGIPGLLRDWDKALAAIACRGDSRHLPWRSRACLIQGQPVVLPASLWHAPDYVMILGRRLE